LTGVLRVVRRGRGVDGGRGRGSVFFLVARGVDGGRGSVFFFARWARVWRGESLEVVGFDFLTEDVRGFRVFLGVGVVAGVALDSVDIVIGVLIH